MTVHQIQTCVETVVAVTIPLAIVAIIVERRLSKRGIGVRSIQFLAVATFSPAVILLAMERIIDGSTVAALVGAYVGYLFANIGEFDRQSSKKREAAEKAL